MKMTASILFLICMAFPAGTGIEFFDGRWSEAMSVSRSSGKPIFVDVYADWCGPCKKLRKSFRNKEVGAYYNKNFICYAMDGESREGAAFMKKYGVTSYPTLMILDGNGKVLSRATGFMEPYILINFGRRVVP